MRESKSKVYDRISKSISKEVDDELDELVDEHLKVDTNKEDFVRVDDAPKEFTEKFEHRDKEDLLQLLFEKSIENNILFREVELLKIEVDRLKNN